MFDVSSMNELIASIKFIKFFAWESRWEAKVDEARQAEMRSVAQLLVFGLHRWILEVML